MHDAYLIFPWNKALLPQARSQTQSIFQPGELGLTIRRGGLRCSGREVLLRLAARSMAIPSLQLSTARLQPGQGVQSRTSKSDLRKVSGYFQNFGIS